MKQTICENRQKKIIFYEEIGGKNTEMEKWGIKMMTRVQFIVWSCVLFFTFSPIYKKILGGGGDLENIHPCAVTKKCWRY